MSPSINPFSHSSTGTGVAAPRVVMNYGHRCRLIYLRRVQARRGRGHAPVLGGLGDDSLSAVDGRRDLSDSDKQDVVTQPSFDKFVNGVRAAPTVEPVTKGKSMQDYFAQMQKDTGYRSPETSDYPYKGYH